MEHGIITQDIENRYWLILSDKYMMNERDVVTYDINKNKCVIPFISIGLVEQVNDICKWNLIEFRKEFNKKVREIKLYELAQKKEELLKELKSIDKQINNLL